MRGHRRQAGVALGGAGSLACSGSGRPPLSTTSRRSASGAGVGSGLAGSAIGAVLAGDFLTLFVFWEGTAISSVLLASSLLILLNGIQKFWKFYFASRFERDLF